LDGISEKENDEGVISFVADQIPYLKWIPVRQWASVENERVRAQKLLSREGFLQVQDWELNALFGSFEINSSTYKENFLVNKDFSKEIPGKESGRF